MAKRNPHRFGELVHHAFEESERTKGQDPGKAVKFTVLPHLRNIFELEIEGEELDEIAEAAESQGMEVDDFIRGAALDRARKTKQMPRAAKA